MSKATKRKHVVKEVDDLSVPKESQSIVQVLESRGNNLHEVRNSAGEQYLVSMPVKFRRNIWIKRGDFVLVDPILEGDKVKAEIVKILTREHIKWYRTQKCWPSEFDKSRENEDMIKTKEVDEEDEENLFVNTNRIMSNSNDKSDDTDTSSDESSE